MLIYISKYSGRERVKQSYCEEAQRNKRQMRKTTKNKYFRCGFFFLVYVSSKYKIN